MIEDLTENLLAGCSPCISSMDYDADKNVLIIECVNNPDEMVPKKRIKLSGIKKYSEEQSEKNDFIDSIIGINWLEKYKLCIKTEKKELILELENEPESETIA